MYDNNSLTYRKNILSYSDNKNIIDFSLFYSTDNNSFDNLNFRGILISQRSHIYAPDKGKNSLELTASYLITTSDFIKLYSIFYDYVNTGKFKNISKQVKIKLNPHVYVVFEPSNNEIKKDIFSLVKNGKSIYFKLKGSDTFTKNFIENFGYVVANINKIIHDYYGYIIRSHENEILFNITEEVNRLLSKGHAISYEYIKTIIDEISNKFLGNISDIISKKIGNTLNQDINVSVDNIPNNGDMILNSNSDTENVRLNDSEKINDNQINEDIADVQDIESDVEYNESVDDVSETDSKIETSPKTLLSNITKNIVNKPTKSVTERCGYPNIIRLIGYKFTRAKFKSFEEYFNAIKDVLYNIFGVSITDSMIKELMNNHRLGEMLELCYKIFKKHQETKDKNILNDITEKINMNIIVRHDMFHNTLSEKIMDGMLNINEEFNYLFDGVFDKTTKYGHFKLIFGPILYGLILIIMAKRSQNKNNEIEEKPIAKIIDNILKIDKTLKIDNYFSIDSKKQDSNIIKCLSEYVVELYGEKEKIIEEENKTNQLHDEHDVMDDKISGYHYDYITYDDVQDISDIDTINNNEELVNEEIIENTVQDYDNHEENINVFDDNIDDIDAIESAGVNNDSVDEEDIVVETDEDVFSLLDSIDDI